MSFRHYLKDRLGWILIFGLSLGLIHFFIWLQPQKIIHQTQLLYLDLLLILLNGSYLLYHYQQQRRWYQALTQYDHDFDWQLNLAQSYDQQLLQAYLNQRQQKAKQALNQLMIQNDDQREFIASWVHDIKVPLAAIQLLIDDQREKLSDTKAFQLSDELQQISHYVDEVLYYSRLDSFSKDYLLQTYDLTQITKQVIKANATYFLKKQIQIQLNGPALNVLTDEKWLFFILNQILSNSLKYTPAHGTITITFAQQSQAITLTVADTGCGIPAHELPRIFDKGFTGTNGRQINQNATGLGLYLAQQLSQKLGHQLTATATPGQGTQLTLTFPTLSYYNSL